MPCDGHPDHKDPDRSDAQVPKFRGHNARSSGDSILNFQGVRHGVRRTRLKSRAAHIEPHRRSIRSCPTDPTLIASHRGRDSTLRVFRLPRTQRSVVPWLCSRYCAPNKNVTKFASILERPARRRLESGLRVLAFRTGMCKNACNQGGAFGRILTGEIADGLDTAHGSE
jgi:hypothetical protein